MRAPPRGSYTHAVLGVLVAPLDDLASWSPVEDSCRQSLERVVARAQQRECASRTIVDPQGALSMSGSLSFSHASRTDGDRPDSLSKVAQPSRCTAAEGASKESTPEGASAPAAGGGGVVDRLASRVLHRSTAYAESAAVAPAEIRADGDTGDTGDTGTLSE